MEPKDGIWRATLALPEDLTALAKRSEIPDDVNVAAEAGGPLGTLSALVATYGVDFQMGPGTYHHFVGTPFAASIAAKPQTPLFIDHQWGMGSAPAGFANMVEDAVEGGLVGHLSYFTYDQNIRRLYDANVAGAINEFSIGYKIIEAEKLASETEDGDEISTAMINAAELVEVSSVIRGANITRILGASDGDDEIDEAAHVWAPSWEQFMRLSQYLARPETPAARQSNPTQKKENI